VKRRKKIAKEKGNVRKRVFYNFMGAPIFHDEGLCRSYAIRLSQGTKASEAICGVWPA